MECTPTNPLGIKLWMYQDQAHQLILELICLELWQQQPMFIPLLLSMQQVFTTAQVYFSSVINDFQHMDNTYARN